MEESINVGGDPHHPLDNLLLWTLPMHPKEKGSMIHIASTDRAYVQHVHGEGHKDLKEKKMLLSSLMMVPIANKWIKFLAFIQ